MRLRTLFIGTALSALTVTPWAQQTASPISAAIVLDSSGSMGFGIHQAKQAALDVVRAANPGDEFALVEARDLPLLAAGFAPRTDSLVTRISGVQARGRSALFDAIYVGLHQAALARNARRPLVVFTDGTDNASRFTPEEIRTLANQVRARIVVVPVGPPEAAAQLAERIGATVVAPGELSRALRE